MKVISIDFDGIIMDKNKNPILSNINKVNKLYENKDNFIVIYTARSMNLYEEVFKTLKQFEVKFHALVMEKLRADYYVDDKSTNLNRLL